VIEQKTRKKRYQKGDSSDYDLSWGISQLFMLEGRHGATHEVYREPEL